MSSYNQEDKMAQAGLASDRQSDMQRTGERKSYAWNGEAAQTDKRTAYTRYGAGAQTKGRNLYALDGFDGAGDRSYDDWNGDGDRFYDDRTDGQTNDRGNYDGSEEFSEFFQRSRAIEERRARERQKASEAARRRKERREEQLRKARIRFIMVVAGIAAAILLVILGVRFAGSALANRSQNASAGTDSGTLTANAAEDTAGEDNQAGRGGNDGTANGTAGSEGTGAAGTSDAGAGTGSDGSSLPSAEQVATDRAAKNYSAAVATFWPYYSFHKTTQTQAIPTVSADAAADAPAGSMVSTYGIVVDVDNGEIVAQRQMDERIVPASMTKVMTLLVAVETLGLNENSPELHDMVTLTTADEEYAYVNGSSAVCWMPGDTASVEDLMYGTILPSGADAAMALAEHTAGTADAFVELMNQKAEELGIGKTTHFTNCVGVYDEDHYSTVYDVAIIMKAALENDLCRKVLAEHTWTTSPTSEHPEGITVSNWFLRRIEDKDTHGLVLCAKTGYVNESGFCAVSYQESDDGSHLIVCTAASSGNWRCINDHVSLYQKYAQEVAQDETTETTES